MARAAYQYALEYAKQRVQFGRPILKIRRFLHAGRYRTKIDAARLYVARGGWPTGENPAPWRAAWPGLAAEVAMK